MSASSAIPALSVLLAVHNGQRHLPAAVESLLCQTFRDFELIAVDDASTDETPSLLADYTRRDGRVVVVRNETNLGLAGALNRGLKHCRAAWVARADADDVYLPHRLQRQWDYLQAHPDVGISGTGVDFIDDAGATRADPPPQIWTTDEELRFHSLFGCSLWHTVVVFRREIVMSLGGYSDAFRRGPEDYDLWARALSAGVRLGNLRDVLCHVRLHSASSTARWEEGFRLYCTVARRLLAEYLGLALEERGVHGAVVLKGWSVPLPEETVRAGIALLQQVRQVAGQRERAKVYHPWRVGVATALLRHASLLSYTARAASRLLWREAARWDGRLTARPSFWKQWLRTAAPGLVQRTRRPACAADP